MKRINFLLGVLAVTSTALFSSCFSSDGADETPEVPTVKPVEDKTPYVLVPSSNVDEDVRYEWNPTTFEKGTTVTVTAKAVTTGKYTTDTQTKKVTVGDEKQVSVYFVFTEKPAPAPVVVDEDVTEAVTIYQGEKDAKGESNSTDNANNAAQSVVIDEEEKITVGQVSLEIPVTAVADAKATAQSTAFSIVVVPAADENIEQVSASNMKDVEDATKSEPLEATAMQAICEPTGAKFKNPVTIAIQVPESDGIEFTAVNGKDEASNCKAEGNVLKMDVSHFSAWDILLVAKIENFQIKESVTIGKQNVKKGENEISYESTYGWSTKATNALVRSYLVSQLGSSKSRTVVVKAKYESTGEGVATYRVISKTAEFDVKSGRRTFHVVANIGSELKIDNVTAIQPGHSGGTAN